MTDLRISDTTRQFKPLRGKNQIITFFQMCQTELNFDWQEFSRGTFLEKAKRGKYFEINESDFQRLRAYKLILEDMRITDAISKGDDQN